MKIKYLPLQRCSGQALCEDEWVKGQIYIPVMSKVEGLQCKNQKNKTFQYEAFLSIFSIVMRIVKIFD
jgi:hypothetical protein